MIKSVLVVCVGNICRSPIGERILRAALPDITVTSAGIAAVVGAGADPMASLAAQEIGIELNGHVARQLDCDIGGAHDLILVMEDGHRAAITRKFPQLAGRTMLFDRWNGENGIADPYRQPIEAHRASRDLIVSAADAWAKKLSKPA